LCGIASQFLGLRIIIKASHKRDFYCRDAGTASMLIELYRFSTLFVFYRIIKFYKIYSKSSISGRKRSSSLSHPDITKKPLLQEFFKMSGCRESNPALVFPKHVYYRYTTPRYNFLILTYFKIITIYFLNKYFVFANYLQI
jgi:hypothetical protein